MDNPAEVPLFNAVDIGVLALLLVSAVLAYFRGLVHEVLSIGGWIGAAFATIYGFPYLRPHARTLTDIEILADFGAGVVIFVVSLVLFSLVARSISKRVKDSALNAVDRSLGFLFGIVRGALVVVVAYIGLGLVYPADEQPDWITQARSMELVAPGAAWLTAMIPDDLTGGGKDKDGSDEPKDAAPTDKAAEGRKKVVQELLTPAPKGPKQADPDGYDERQRQQMDRLLHDSTKAQ